VETALGLLDDVGLDGLSMRHLAERLGVNAATLYWYIRDKHELLSLIAETICAEIQPLDALDANTPWRVRLETLMWEYRRALLAHRDAAHILAATLPAGVHRLRLVDLALGAGLAAGFEGWAASRVARLVVDYTTGFVQEEYVTAARPAQQAHERNERGARGGGTARLPTITEAPVALYPNIVTLSPYLADRDSNARFRFGLSVILDGLEQRRPH